MDDHTATEPVDFVSLPLPAAAMSPARVRLLAAIILTACGSVLGLAAYLSPNPRGFGTHQQLGLAPCGLILTTGFPCPTCGMTTAFSHSVRGQPFRAMYAQPSGFVLALATIAAAAGSLWTLATGRVPPIRIPIITPYRLAIVLLLLFFGGWGIKVVLGLMDGTLPIRSVLV